MRNKASAKTSARRNQYQRTTELKIQDKDGDDTDRDDRPGQRVEGMFDQRVSGKSAHDGYQQRGASFDIQSRPSQLNGKMSLAGYTDNIALIQRTQGSSDVAKNPDPYQHGDKYNQFGEELSKPVKMMTFDPEQSGVASPKPVKKVQRPVEIFNVAHKSGYQNKYWCAAHEILGTAFLLLAVQWGTVSGHTPKAVGLSVFCFAVIIGQVSGGHMNPAVSTALFMRECHRNYQGNLCTFFLYIISQILGGILGIMIGFIGIGAEVNPHVNTLADRNNLGSFFIAYLCPANGCHVTGYFGQVVLVETLMTFFFAGSVVAIAKWDSARDGPANCLVIGISLFTAIQIAGGISGGAVNPAVALLQPIYQTLATEWRIPNFDLAQIERSNYHGAYVLGTILGGILAGCFHRWAIPMARDLRDEGEKISKKMR